MKTRLLHFFMILLAVLLSGCSSGQQIVTPSATIPATKTNTSTPTPTQTATPVFTATPSPTTDPVLLLPTYEPQEFLDHLLHDDDICKLPCWGNIETEMTWDATFRYLRPIIESTVYEYTDPKLYPPYYNGFSSVANESGERVRAFFYYDRDGVIQLIETRRVGYDMQHLIQTYGRPEEFYFFSFYDIEYAYKRMTNVFFYYPNQHFMAVFTQVDDVNSVINFCSSNIEKNRSPDLMIWAGEEDFESLANLYFKKSGRHDLIQEVKDYATEEEIDSFFASANEEEMCLVLDYPWDNR